MRSMEFLVTAAPVRRLEGLDHGPLQDRERGGEKGGRPGQGIRVSSGVRARGAEAGPKNAQVDVSGRNDGVGQNFSQGTRILMQSDNIKKWFDPIFRSATVK